MVRQYSWRPDWYEGVPIDQIGSAGDFAALLADFGLPAQHVGGSLELIYRLRELNDRLARGA